jgi:hypothetical protein
MASTTSHSPRLARRPTRRPTGVATRSERFRRKSGRTRHEHAPARPRSVLGRYVDWRGGPREVIARPGHRGSVLVIDRDADTLGDRRLVAHIAADEPVENAAVACRCYLEQARRGRCPCRRLTPEDLRSVPFPEEPDGESGAPLPDAVEKTDPLGRRYGLERLPTGMSIPELRWCRRSSPRAGGEPQAVSMREAIACLQSYEPFRMLTRRALALHADDSNVSTAVLRIELARIQASPIVLNRALREAVLAAVDRQGLSMSEIAIRCGRVKRDSAGNESGETSWLARRLGILPEGGRDTPTPWIHSDVLALIARDGLGISPREVEVE